MTTALETLRRRESNFDNALNRALGLAKKLAKPGMPGTEAAGGAGVDPNEVERAVDAIGNGQVEAAFGTPGGLLVEAIVRSALRPSFYISKDKVLSKREGLSTTARRIMDQMELEFDDRPLFDQKQGMLEKQALSAGRLNLAYGFRAYAGSGWLVDKDIVVTNRHVADFFARRWMHDEWDFLDGQFGNKVQVWFNPVNQIDTDDDRSARISEILWIAGSGEPDMALLRIRNPGVEPISLDETVPGQDQPVALIGYPARDPRDNPEHLIVSFFGDTFGVKRFAPGRVMSTNTWELSHDASSLGGNSGSVVIDMNTGKALGLHFAGAAQERNAAVPAALVAAALRRLKTAIAMPAVGASELATEASTAENFADRKGYDMDFLGKPVPRPGLGRREEDLAPVEGADDNELRYCHFSVWQSRSRRLPMMTAVNIDGTRLRRLHRSGRWRLDGRLKDEHQVGNVLYRSNPLDRGHMVRRLDPCWAEDLDDEETVLKAQADTFHYTNSAPQHRDLNQQDWVGLEDYILDSSEDYGFKLSVFTGPVLREDDRPLRNQQGAEDICIPREFWKVAVMRRKDNGALSATGYVLSHGEMISGLTEAEFVLGAYETYQVPLSLIEEATKFDFGDLKRADPLAVDSGREATFGREVRAIRSSSDLVL